MDEPSNHRYAAADYAALTPEKQRALDAVARSLTGDQLAGADDKTLTLTFNILRPCDGCLPEEEIGDDLLAAIRRKFTCIYYPAVERVEDALKAEGFHFFDDFSFCLVIDPCYENSTHVAVVDLRPDARPFCYFHEYTKAWHFVFETLSDIAEAVLQAEVIIRANFFNLRAPTEKRMNDNPEEY